MGLLKFLDEAGDFFEKYNVGRTIGTLIALDRAEAVRTLENVARGWTPQEFDQFEINFLNASMGMFTPQQRVRSMELYAYLKVLETAQHRQWRGFSGSTERGALS